jgi:hypothetical protein
MDDQHATTGSSSAPVSRRMYLSIVHDDPCASDPETYAYTMHRLPNNLAFASSVLTNKEESTRATFELFVVDYYKLDDDPGKIWDPVDILSQVASYINFQASKLTSRSKSHISRIRFMCNTLLKFYQAFRHSPVNEVRTLNKALRATSRQACSLVDGPYCRQIETLTIQDLEARYEAARDSCDPQIMQTYVACVLAFTSAARYGSYAKVPEAKKNTIPDVRAVWEQYGPLQ